jgi:hypothetical protein
MYSCVYIRQVSVGISIHCFQDCHVTFERNETAMKLALLVGGFILQFHTQLVAFNVGMVLVIKCTK